MMAENIKRKAAHSGWVAKGRRIPGFFYFLFFGFCFPASAQADGIAVRKADAHFSDSGYQLSADFDVGFNSVVEQALTQGVPLYFVSEFSLTRPRWYWLDETVAQSEQAVKLSYNSLTGQYRITRGTLFQNFASLDAAINTIRRQSAEPIPPGQLAGGDNFLAEKLLKKDSGYIAAVRMHLDVSQLPKPLQVNALTNNDWNIDSGWYRWIVHPDTTAQQR